jgi:hypothetical protein
MSKKTIKYIFIILLEAVLILFFKLLNDLFFKIDDFAFGGMVSVALIFVISKYFLNDKDA